ncbi:MAG: CAP domain-containing protein [Solirubrobacterales bacterium]
MRALAKFGDVRAFALIAIAGLSVAASSSPASAADAPVCTGADQTAATLTIAQTRTAITCLLNVARDDKAPLRADVRLSRAAQRFARALDPAKPLTHTGRGETSPLDRIAAVGYPRGGSFSAAETLGRSRGSLTTPARRVKNWLASPSTRRLLTSTRYRDVGIGVVTRGSVTTFVVEVAARRTAANVTPSR